MAEAVYVAGVPCLENIDINSYRGYNAPENEGAINDIFVKKELHFYKRQGAQLIKGDSKKVSTRVGILDQGAPLQKVSDYEKRLHEVTADLYIHSTRTSHICSAKESVKNKESYKKLRHRWRKGPLKVVSKNEKLIIVGHGGPRGNSITYKKLVRSWNLGNVPHREYDLWSIGPEDLAYLLKADGLALAHKSILLNMCFSGGADFLDYKPAFARALSGCLKELGFSEVTVGGYKGIFHRAMGIMGFHDRRLSKNLSRRPSLQDPKWFKGRGTISAPNKNR